MLHMAARAIVAILALAVVAGCPAKPEPAVPPAEGDAAAETPTPPDDPPQPDPAEPTPTPTPSGSIADGGACLRAEECSSGICEGERCDDAHPGKCVPSDRMCTRDARSYCGCDGKTFVGSGSCPGRRYRSASACEGDPGPIGQ
jgi:hypothetical protein